MIETFGTATISEDNLLNLVKNNFDLRPAGIIQMLGLSSLPAQRNGRFYQDVAAYGHFGRTDLDLPWERTDKVDLLKNEAQQTLATV